VTLKGKRSAIQNLGQNVTGVKTIHLPHIYTVVAMANLR
jgi:hypothetical protein